MNQPTLRPQDILVLAKLLSYRGPRPPMAQMGIDLSISSSEVHAALKRLALSRLISSDATGNRPLLEPVQEFLVHRLKCAFPAKRGEVTRGVPTSYAASPLNRRIQPGSELLPVWPCAEGAQRGVTLEPLYKTVPAAALRDPFLYELLALLDALRDGRDHRGGLVQPMRHAVRSFAGADAAGGPQRGCADVPLVLWRPHDRGDADGRDDPRIQQSLLQTRVAVRSAYSRRGPEDSAHHGGLISGDEVGGIPRTISDEQVEAVIVKTLETLPAGETHWSTRTMAAKAGMSHTMVGRIWRTFGLTPHSTHSITISPDPQLVGTSGMSSGCT